MRYLLASLIVGCCTVCYAQEEGETESKEVAKEVAPEAPAGDSSAEVANVDSARSMIDFDCGCGNKDRKPKI